MVKRSKIKFSRILIKLIYFINYRIRWTGGRARGKGGGKVGFRMENIELVEVKRGRGRGLVKVIDGAWIEMGGETINKMKLRIFT